MSSLRSLLAAHQLRVTSPRQQIFSLLSELDRPLSIREISQHCPRIDRTSIYRTLELFTRLQITIVIPIGWKHRYELAEPFKPHHHHLQCTTCKELIAIDTPRLENMISDLATTHGYTLSHHHIELLGTCKKCINSIS